MLKLSPGEGGESHSLARLQHTHIVPLYGLHEFPDRALRGLCLPYLGGATLDRVLAQLASIPPARRSGLTAQPSCPPVARARRSAGNRQRAARAAPSGESAPLRWHTRARARLRSWSCIPSGTCS